MRQIFGEDPLVTHNEIGTRRGRKVQIIDGDYNITALGKPAPVSRRYRGKGKATIAKENTIMAELEEIMETPASVTTKREKKVLQRPRKFVQLEQVGGKASATAPTPNQTIAHPETYLPHQFYQQPPEMDMSNLATLVDASVEIGHLTENAQFDGPSSPTAELNFSAAQ